MESGGGGATASASSIGGDSNINIITTDIVQHRLQTGVGHISGGGGRGSLTKCVSVLSNVIQHCNNDDTDSGSNTIQEQMIRELKLQELELLKLSYIVERNQKEIDLMETCSTSDTTDNNTTDDDNDIQLLRNELRLQQQIQMCYNEYETIATIIIKRHSISCYTLQQQMEDLDAKLQNVQTQLNSALNTEHVRECQFQLLQHCINDMKQSLNMNSTTNKEPFVLQEYEKKFNVMTTAGETSTRTITQNNNTSNNRSIDMDIDSMDVIATKSPTTKTNRAAPGYDSMDDAGLYEDL